MMMIHQSNRAVILQERIILEGVMMLMVNKMMHIIWIAIHLHMLVISGNLTKKFEPRRPQSKVAVNDDGIAREHVSHLPSKKCCPDREISVPPEERSPMTSAQENKREHITGDPKDESTEDGKQSRGQLSSHSIGSDREQAVEVADEMNDGSEVDDRSFNMVQLDQLHYLFHNLIIDFILFVVVGANS